MKKKTHEEYIKDLLIKNSNLEVVGIYVDAKTQILHRCKKHNVVWNISPSNALKGQGCQKCKYEKISTNQLKSHEQYVTEVELLNPHVVVLGVYTGASVAILHKCKYCGKEWNIRPSDVLNGKSCRECSCKRFGQKMRKSHQQYIEDLLKVNMNIEPIEDYINTDTAILHKCKVCSHIWQIKPNHTLSGHGCPMCGFKNNADAKRKTHGDYVKELLIINSDIEVLEEYVNYNTRILHKCKICGYEWHIDPGHTLRGQGCPICNQSHGEREISQWLRNHSIDYIPQYKFEDCRDKLELPFDFYIPEFNICIEYDGLQHFEPIDLFGGEESLKITQLHDNIKTNYCKENQIVLIRIAYNQNISEELNKFLLI